MWHIVITWIVLVILIIVSCRKGFIEIYNDIKMSIIIDKEQNKKLKQIEGIKIREQNFNNVLRLTLNWLFVCIIVSIVVYIKDYDLFYGFIIPFDIALSISVIIMYLINILNRKFLGKIILVISDEGIYSTKKFLPWEKIGNIRFNIRIGSVKGPRSLQRIEELYINNRMLVTGEYKSKGFTISSYDFPLYGFKILKKYVKNNKNIEVSVKGRKFEIIEESFYIVIAILLAFSFII